ncbi:hypothetical protein BDP55DRAFT_630019 [Colletotrichum godetiae]|uniref:Uncharacterized protein n=1 Tax=Colletotrichum godetiae TaxID=1209918 RepID=A0AAJ0APA2_9PEZI|nr:uncharacterized protein BDP55DRAFT_630019 [Colletotrichum godetiae]KAK1687884.1 hypothetical protein BDP55DRAFT_630019 [Colletotrichum godetiae]
MKGKVQTVGDYEEGSFDSISIRKEDQFKFKVDATVCPVGPIVPVVPTVPSNSVILVTSTGNFYIQHLSRYCLLMPEFEPVSQEIAAATRKARSARSENMACIPSLPLNVFEAQQKQVVADGTDYLADVKVRLNVVRGGFDDTATDLGFARDEPITFNGLDDLTRVATVAAFMEQAAPYRQTQRRVVNLGEAIRSIWKELPLKGVIPKEIIVEDAEARQVAEMREKNSEVIKEKATATEARLRKAESSVKSLQSALQSFSETTQGEPEIDQDDSEMDQDQSQEDMCNAFKKCVTGLKTQIASLKERNAALELRADTTESNIKHLQDSLGTEQQRVMDLSDDNKKAKMKLRELGEDYAYESTLATTNGGKYLDLKSFHDILKSENAKLEADHKGLVSSHREANSAHGNAIRDMQLKLSKAESTLKDLELKLKEAHSNHSKAKSAHENAIKALEKRLSDDATSHEEAIKEIETRMTDAVFSNTEATTSPKNSHVDELVNVAQQHEEVKVREHDVWFYTASEKLERMRSDLEAERTLHNITVADIQTARAELVAKTTHFDAKVEELRQEGVRLGMWYLHEAPQIAVVDDVDPTFPEYLTLTIPAEDGDYSGDCEIVRRQGWPLCVMFNTAKKVCWFVNPDCCKLTLLQWSFRGPSRTMTMVAMEGKAILFRARAWLDVLME